MNKSVLVVLALAVALVFGAAWKMQARAQERREALAAVEAQKQADARAEAVRQEARRRANMLPSQVNPPPTKPAASVPAAPPVLAASEPESESKDVPFAECVGRADGAALAVQGTQYRAIRVVTSPDLLIRRICTNDGSVLITCARSGGEEKMVVTKSDYVC